MIGGEKNRNGGLSKEAYLCNQFHSGSCRVALNRCPFPTPNTPVWYSRTAREQKKQWLIGRVRFQGRLQHHPVPVLRAYQPPLVVDGEFGFEPVSQLRATSAASSLALARFLPSYQNLALCTDPCTVTLLDHAVRPP
jgi:hypothetical protein